LGLLVKDVMSTHLTSLPVDRSAREAAELMARADVGSVLVFAEGEPVGIVTERDFVRKIVSEGIDAAKVLVADVMSTPMVTIPSMASLEEASKTMTTYDIRYLPVVEEGEVVGIVGTRDIAMALAKEQNFEDVRLNAVAGVKPGSLPPSYD